MSISIPVFDQIAPPSDTRLIKDIYTAETENVSEPNSWTRLRVTIWYNAPDGSKIEAYTYDRNYSMLNSFMPFRQYKDGVWRDYAIISPNYTTFEVIELHPSRAGRVIATRPNPKPAAGFCGVDYYIPDIMEVVDPEDFNLTEDSDPFDHQWLADGISTASGQYGWYSGCVWGDDSSWKLRHIDLSQISEGIVTEDERYGYWELPEGPLAQHIEISPDAPLRISMSMYVLPSGKVLGSTRDSVNWDESD